MDSAKLQFAFLQELGNTASLRTGERHIQLFSNTFFEYIQMFRKSQHGLNHVQIMNLSGINLAQAFSQEVSLLLVVAFDVNFVVRFDYSFQQSNCIFSINNFPFLDQRSSIFCALHCVLFQSVPLTGNFFELHYGLSFLN